MIKITCEIEFAKFNERARFIYPDPEGVPRTKKNGPFLWMMFLFLRLGVLDVLWERVERVGRLELYGVSLLSGVCLSFASGPLREGLWRGVRLPTRFLTPLSSTVALQVFVFEA